MKRAGIILIWYIKNTHRDKAKFWDEEYKRYI